MIDKIIDCFPEDEFIKVDGFDEAIIGVDINTMRLVYSVSNCIKILMQYMSEEDAEDYFYLNVHGSYIGDKTPIFNTDDF